MIRLVAVAIAILVGFSGFALAHPLGFNDVLVIAKSDGTYLVDLTVDLDALALGVSKDSPSQELFDELESMSVGQFELAVERARDTLLRRVRIRFDGDIIRPDLTFPDLETGRLREDSEPSVLGLTARFSGPIPEGAQEVSFFVSRALGPSYVTFLSESNAQVRQAPLEEGAISEPFSLLPVEPGEGVVDGNASGFSTFAQYVRLGFVHILPRGLDHILFVLGLFLICKTWKPLLIQVSAFTLAHTVTLGLSISGLISLPSQLVETLIALSIAWIAFENIVFDEMKSWRPLVVFGFGLLHGLGFAGVLGELGLPESQSLTALLGFNLGVEFGQLAVVALALAAVGWARNREWYRARIVIPVSVLIGLVGLYWTWVRGIGG